MRRFMPRAMGRAFRIEKKTSHVYVVLGTGSPTPRAPSEGKSIMGQKVHPIGFRLGRHPTWDSKWYEEKNYAQWLHEDIHIREFVKKKLGHAGISTVEIERAANKVKVNVHTARPGIVIGKRGAGIETHQEGPPGSSPRTRSS